MNVVTRRCKVCYEDLPITSFPFAGSANSRNGLTHRRYKCQRCYQASKRQRRKQTRNWFDDYKKSYQCESCGLQDHRVLDFHHPDNDKEINVADAVSQGWSKDRILIEVQKCRCLCANCHRILHWEEKQ